MLENTQSETTVGNIRSNLVKHSWNRFNVKKFITFLTKKTPRTQTLDRLVGD